MTRAIVIVSSLPLLPEGSEAGAAFAGGSLHERRRHAGRRVNGDPGGHRVGARRSCSGRSGDAAPPGRAFDSDVEGRVRSTQHVVKVLTVVGFAIPLGLYMACWPITR